MVLYYGLLALETANNIAASKPVSIPKKSKASIEKMSSSSNSWIYTEDLRKRFEERCIDYRYVFIPVYIDGKKSHHNSSTTAIISPKSFDENSWMYARPLRDHLFNSTPKISSSACCVTNQAFMRDDYPRKKSSKMKFFQRSSSEKAKSTTHSSPIKYQTNDPVEEDDESTENENYSVPLIKHE